jgi:hypothetical protein
MILIEYSINIIFLGAIMLSKERVYGENKEKGNKALENELMIRANSAYIPNNPDFDPSKDVPQARSCDTMLGIIGNN